MSFHLLAPSIKNGFLWTSLTPISLKQNSEGLWQTVCRVETHSTYIDQRIRDLSEENCMECQPCLGLFLVAVKHFLMYTGPLDVFLFLPSALDHNPVTLNCGFKTETTHLKQQRETTERLRQQTTDEHC